MTTSEALQKLRHYCAYQERSPFEVKRKLSLIKLPSKYHEEVITTLMDENFLDEYRFAEAFVKGKINQKHWAPRRIRAGLQEHRIPAVTISRIIASVDPDKVWKNALYLANRWLKSKTKEQLTAAMQRRGYTFEMINKAYQEAVSEHRI